MWLIQGHSADEEVGIGLASLAKTKTLNQRISYLVEIVCYIKLLHPGFISFTSITKQFSLMLL